MTNLTVYIDEAGDPGVREGAHYGALRHEWLTLSACVIRTDRQLEPVEWVEGLRQIACSNQSTSLHYAKVSKNKRVDLCSAVTQLPLRAFCVASHKSNMRSHTNKVLGKIDKGDKFYNWCMRLLLERVTRWAERWHNKEGTKLDKLNIVFAHRGGHDYDAMFSYFDRLRGQLYSQGPKLSGMGLKEPTLDRSNWLVEPAERIAGCQLADVIASAVYQGANSASPNWDLEPAILLKKIFAKDRAGVAANMGLTVWPLTYQAPLPDESRQLFRAFGYKV